MNARLTVDYGMRFYWLQPTYDTRLQASNFIPGKYDAAKAPRLYYPARDAAGNRVGLDRATGAMVSAVNIGRLVPGSGSLVGNGLYGAGEGIDEQLYQNRGIHYAPRDSGFAYDVARQPESSSCAAAAGVFYDRAAGDTVYGMIEQPPTLNQPNLFYGRLQDLNAPPAAPMRRRRCRRSTTRARSPRSTATTWVCRCRCRGTSALDVSFVGSQSRNLNTQVNLNAPSVRRGVPARRIRTRPLLRRPSRERRRCRSTSSAPIEGFGDIIQIQPTAYADYKSLQSVVEPSVQSRLLIRLQLRARQGDGHVEHRFSGRQQHVQPERDRYATHRQRRQPAEGELHAADDRPTAHGRRQLRVAAAKRQRGQPRSGCRDSRLAGVRRLPGGIRRALHRHLQHSRHLALHADRNAAPGECAHRHHRRSGIGI